MGQIRRRKWLVYVLAALLLLAAGRLLGCRLARSLPPPLPWSARQLAQTYQDNPVNGERLYQGRLLAIQGQILAIDLDDLGRPYLLLEGSAQLEIQCFFFPSQQQQLATLLAGQQVSLSGLCRGYQPGHSPLVKLTDCYFE